MHTARSRPCLAFLTATCLLIPARPAPGGTPFGDLLRNKLQQIDDGGEAGKDMVAAQFALAIAEKELPPDHPKVAMQLNNLALTYFRMGNFTAAEPLYLRALGIYQKTPGPVTHDMAAVHSNLAILYDRQSRNDEAEPHSKRALAILEELSGPDSLDAATGLNNLASVWVGQGRYTEAVKATETALALRMKHLGPVHPNVASSLNMLGIIHVNQGKYSEAQDCFIRGIAAVEGIEDPEDVLSVLLVDYAMLQKACGRLASAEALIRRALASMEKARGRENPFVATVLNSLAVLYDTQGQYDLSEPLRKRALAIQEKRLGASHPDVAASLNNQGLRCESLGRTAEAEALLQRALAIYQKHPDTPPATLSTILGNIGTLRQHSRRLEEAEEFHQRSLDIIVNAFGADHPECAVPLNNIAAVLTSRGNLEQAETAIRRSIGINGKALGPDCPQLTESLEILADICNARGRHGEAFDTLVRKNSIEEKLIDQVFSFSSEKGRFQFLATLEAGRDQFLSSCTVHPDPRGPAAVMDFLLRRKGVIIDSLAEDAATSRLAGDPAQKERMTRLREVKSRLSAMAIAGAGGEDLATHQASVAKLLGEAEELEKELARQSAVFRRLRAARSIDLAEVSATLPPASALVEFACFRRVKSGMDIPNADRAGPHYLACILLHGEGTPVLVQLGEAARIDQLIGNFQRSMQSFINGKATASDVNAASDALARVVWDPLEEHLVKIRRLFLCPDGRLNFVSFAGLRNKAGRFLLEDHDLSYVASGRDLARKESPASAEPLTAALVGAPAFGGTESNPLGEMITRGASALDTLHFDNLPGTREEIRIIESLTIAKGLKTRTFLGPDASEEQVKALEKPGILHLATHGFFLPPPVRTADQTGRIRAPEPGITEAVADPPPQNPMHRSGLALAGANLAFHAGTSTKRQDGILTAAEVAGLDLEGTRLVVLSACETGLGESRSGEGVMGLRRAFAQAGAGNLIVALWQLPDDATRSVMTSFYQHHLAGRPAWLALLESQREALAAARKSGTEPNPFLWAGLVANGTGNQ